MAITRPLETEYAPHFHTYISKVPNNNLIEALNDSYEKLLDLLLALPKEKYEYRYAPGKWSITELLAHLIDCERVFAYRALVFARNDQAALPGFDEDEYATAYSIINRSMNSYIEEYKHLRKSNILFFGGLTDEMGLRKGVSNGKEISVRALGFAISGHELHHMQVIRERYL
jgi:DinB superfamily